MGIELEDAMVLKMHLKMKCFDELN